MSIGSTSSVANATPFTRTGVNHQLPAVVDDEKKMASSSSSAGASSSILPNNASARNNKFSAVFTFLAALNRKMTSSKTKAKKQSSANQEHRLPISPSCSTGSSEDGRCESSENRGAYVINARHTNTNNLHNKIKNSHNHLHTCDTDEVASPPIPKSTRRPSVSIHAPGIGAPLQESTNCKECSMCHAVKKPMFVKEHGICTHYYCSISCFKRSSN